MTKTKTVKNLCKFSCPQLVNHHYYGFKIKWLFNNFRTMGLLIFTSFHGLATDLNKDWNIKSLWVSYMTWYIFIESQLENSIIFKQQQSPYLISPLSQMALHLGKCCNLSQSISVILHKKILLAWDTICRVHMLSLIIPSN